MDQSLVSVISAVHSRDVQHHCIIWSHRALIRWWQVYISAPVDESQSAASRLVDCVQHLNMWMWQNLLSRRLSWSGYEPGSSWQNCLSRNSVGHYCVGTNSWHCSDCDRSRSSGWSGQLTIAADISSVYCWAGFFLMWMWRKGWLLNEFVVLYTVVKARELSHIFSVLKSVQIIAQ